VRSHLRRRCRRLFHQFYPWTGLNGLDKKLVGQIGPSRNGFFIEVGANDGIRQSNTYYLARRRGWKGLLVEALPDLARLCEKNRPESTVKNCALVADVMNGRTIEIVDVDLMSMVRKDGPEQEEAVQVAETVQGILRSTVTIMGRSLSSLLDELGSPNVDLFSLDVEGYELTVLQGLDLERHSPQWILVETKQVDLVTEMLKNTHMLHSQLTFHDYLFKQRS
jgi:FkbM family methyltransferase